MVVQGVFAVFSTFVRGHSILRLADFSPEMTGPDISARGE